MVLEPSLIYGMSLKLQPLQHGIELSGKFGFGHIPTGGMDEIRSFTQEICIQDRWNIQASLLSKGD